AATMGTGTLNGSGQATFTTSALTLGAHTITAEYGGESSFNSSTSSALTQTVNKADTTNTVVSSANPPAFAQSVTCSATGTANAPGSGTPTGSVVFTLDGSDVATNAVNGSGVATFTTAALMLGSHTVAASYLGDGNYNLSAGSLSPDQTVNKADTTTVVSSSSNPSVFGQGVTFTATVSATAPGSGTPSGTVQFKIDGSDFGSPVSLSGGSASSGTIATLPVGPHVITAVYSGDGNFLAGTSADSTQTVNKANTTSAVSSSFTPSAFGQSVSFTVTVGANAPGAGTLSGTVQFKIDGSNFG